MFTGLVTHLGQIQSLASLTDGCRVVIDSPDITGALAPGDSVAVNGVCSTVTSISGTCFAVDYMKETLEKTTCATLKPGEAVNLELSLTPNSRMGGHFVSGHIDATGEIVRIERRDPWGELRVRFDPQFSPYLIPKGSVCLDGISLTVVEVAADTFTCHLIPHTLEHTILKDKKSGQALNIEFDMLGKYLYRFYTLARS